MPIHPVGVERRYGELGSPYSVRDHLAVGPEYGTLDDLRALIDAAHARGISVLLDWVANHTAWDHPWIADAPGLVHDRRAGDIVHPPGTGWLDVADLDYGNPAMRRR
jgi:glycosidase